LGYADVHEVFSPTCKNRVYNIREVFGQEPINDFIRGNDVEIVATHVIIKRDTAM
jgi:hypothetical protein